MPLMVSKSVILALYDLRPIQSNWMVRLVPFGAGLDRELPAMLGVGVGVGAKVGADVGEAVGVDAGVAVGLGVLVGCGVGVLRTAVG